jgi:hypothetical protein
MHRLLLITALGLAVPGLALAQHNDVSILTEGGTLSVNGYDVDGLELTEGQRVFEGELGLSGSTYEGDEPGFFSPVVGLPAGFSTLPGDTALGFNVLSVPELGRNLSYWDGTGDVVFGALPNSELLKLVGLDLSEAIVDGSNGDVPGFAIGTTSASGFLHQHVEFFLLGDAAESDVASTGVYLLALEAAVAGFENSLPFYFVLGAGVTDTEIDLGIDWVNENLVAVPEPGVSALLAVGLALLARGRVRRGVSA